MFMCEFYSSEIAMSTKVKYHKSMNLSDKEFYTAHDLAEKFSLNVMTIYRYIKSGRLKAHKIGKEFRIAKDEFERFLKNTSTK